MKLASVGFAILSVQVFGSAADWKTAKQQQESFRLESAVLKCETEVASARLRAQSERAEAVRIADLFAHKVVTEMRMRTAHRDATLSEAAASIAELHLKQAVDEKSLAILLPTCQGGAQSACDGVLRIYQNQSVIQVELASVALKKAKAEWDLESFQCEGIRSLVASQALHPDVLAEEALRLKARTEELKGAELQLSLAKKSLIPAVP